MLSMGKSTISMAIFNSYVKLPEGTDVVRCFTINLSTISTIVIYCVHPILGFSHH